MQEHSSRLLKSTEAADRLGISRTTLHWMVRAGKLVRILNEPEAYSLGQSEAQGTDQHGKTSDFMVGV